MADNKSVAKHDHNVEEEDEQEEEDDTPLNDETQADEEMDEENEEEDESEEDEDEEEASGEEESQEDEGSKAGSGGEDDEEEESDGEEPPPVEYNVNSRPKRSTAGNKMAILMSQSKEEQENDPFYTEAFHGGFREDDVEETFNSPRSSVAGDESDEVDSDFDDPEQEEEIEVMPMEDEWDPIRIRKRKLTTGEVEEFSPEELFAKIKELGERISQPYIRPEPTPEEEKEQIRRMAEAMETEKTNIQRMNWFADLEVERKKRRREAILRNPLVGPYIKTISDEKGYRIIVPEVHRWEPAAPVVKVVCAYSGKPAKYKDPVTDCGFSSLRAFRAIRSDYIGKLLQHKKDPIVSKFFEEHEVVEEVMPPSSDDEEDGEDEEEEIDIEGEEANETTTSQEHSRKEQSCPANFPTIVQSVSNSSLNDREEMGCTVTTEHRREEAAAEANTHLLVESSRLHVSSSACQLVPTPLLSRGPSPCLSEVGTSCQPPEHTIHPTIAVEEELEKKEKELHIAEPQYAHRCVDLDVTLDDDNGNGASLQLPSTSDGEASAILEASVGLLEKSLRISDAKVTQLERLVQLQQQDIESLRFEIKWKDDRINNLQKELAKLEYLRPKPASPAGDESQDE
ncbi:unnamed protein product, partial [Mesorhabditis spiculigera]